MNELTKVQQMAVNRLQRKMNRLNGQVEIWKQEMLDDYDKFFCWHADGMYVMIRAIRLLEPILEVAKGYDLDQLKETLRHNIEHFGDDLLHGQLGRSSTNEMVNIAHLLELKAKQELRSFLDSTLVLIEETEKFQDS